MTRDIFHSTYIKNCSAFHTFCCHVRISLTNRSYTMVATAHGVNGYSFALWQAYSYTLSRSTRPRSVANTKRVYCKKTVIILGSELRKSLLHPLNHPT